MTKESKKQENKQITPVLTSKDISMLGLRSAYLQSAFNYEKMQSIGYVVAQAPYLNKIYKNNKEELKNVLKDDLEFINTQPVVAAYLMGLMISLREHKVDRETVKNIKTSLFGPLAGIGDAIFWFTLLPIIIGICASLAESGNVLGPIIFALVYIAIFMLRIPLAHIGYNMGVGAIEKIKENTAKFNKAATIVGVTVLGGLIASYVTIEVLTTFKIGKTGNIISLQTDFLDMILPNLLPLVFTMLMLYLLKKKINPTMLIACIMLFSILLSFLGIL